MIVYILYSCLFLVSVGYTVKKQYVNCTSMKLLMVEIARLSISFAFHCYVNTAIRNDSTTETKLIEASVTQHFMRQPTSIGTHSPQLHSSGGKIPTTTTTTTSTIRRHSVSSIATTIPNNPTVTTTSVAHHHVHSSNTTTTTLDNSSVDTTQPPFLKKRLNTSNRSLGSLSPVSLSPILLGRSTGSASDHSPALPSVSESADEDDDTFMKEYRMTKSK
ncbi:hypothetical protein DFA_10871 [Cavenderia fasciculata]|uniref:Uncharacterized protein n=1 Tax=Cavenderia fasciculata TaxID=261658 RepID=F4QBM5_CACFS|nr:uncharacterized protein DFA_10871 [Cavenderia fasciculata]EGG14613.1 hypothetical protein DFA_10871 [Cavenderia fasciculata]|eukprot:XP_004351121.1 hypothetical protein DFA_10871 [Cavenderia fasciculata]